MQTTRGVHSFSKCGMRLAPVCGAKLDPYGDHLAACPSTGRLKRRGTAFERSLVVALDEYEGTDGSGGDGFQLLYEEAPRCALDEAEATAEPPPVRT